MLQPFFLTYLFCFSFVLPSFYLLKPPFLPEIFSSFCPTYLDPLPDLQSVFKTVLPAASDSPQCSICVNVIFRAIWQPLNLVDSCHFRSVIMTFHCCHAYNAVPPAPRLFNSPLWRSKSVLPARISQIYPLQACQVFTDWTIFCFSTQAEDNLIVLWVHMEVWGFSWVPSSLYILGDSSEHTEPHIMDVAAYTPSSSSHIQDCTPKHHKHTLPVHHATFYLQTSTCIRLV